MTHYNDPDQLWHAAYARQSDPATSHEAARRVDTTKLERMVLGGLDGHGPMTSKEIAAKAGKDKWSISPRMKPLEDGGLVTRTADRRNNSMVWKITEAGRRTLLRAEEEG